MGSLCASDAASEGTWVWEDDNVNFFNGDYETGLPVAGQFVSWGENQPNNDGHDDSNGEQCARTTGLLWNDTPCTLELVQHAESFNGIGYICEKQP